VDLIKFDIAAVPVTCDCQIRIDSMEQNPFEKVIVAQMANRFSSYGTGIFAMAFTTTGHWTLSSDIQINIISSKSLFLSNTLNMDYCSYV